MRHTWIVTLFLSAILLGCGSAEEITSDDTPSPDPVTAGREVAEDAQSKEPVLGGTTENKDETTISSIVKSQLGEQAFGEAVFE